MQKKGTLNRRNFLGGIAVTGMAGALGAGGLLTSCSGGNSSEASKGPRKTAADLGIPEFLDQAPDGIPVKAALIGCGGRGTGAAVNFLNAGPNLEIVALGDVLADKMQNCAETLRTKYNQSIKDENCFLGFDAYQKIMAMPEINLVLLCTPPFYRPTHFEAAVNAGKNVFMEKPCAVDPVGIRSVIANSRKAQSAGLTVVTGNQRRHKRDYCAAFVEVANGAIGDILGASCHWNQGSWWYRRRQAGWSDMEYATRNWTNIIWQCGDHILDQAIHNIDVVTWFMQKTPLEVVGYGGRARRETGDIFDFFSCDYTYPDYVRMLATARQIDGCDSHVGEFLMGTRGVALLNDSANIKLVTHQGELIWEYAYEKGEDGRNKIKSAYDQEHVDLVTAIRTNKPRVESETLAISTLVGIMGREAAYSGKKITWDEIMNSDLKYGPKEIVMGPLPDFREIVPVPGKESDRGERNS